ncbi:MAG: SRPBCC family protein [Stellaceae bacterium]|jgi:phenylpropionate dioxygenase-like ring-hydroxylating dioxygenase large terminal subunit
MRDLNTLIDDRPKDGVFLVHRDVFADRDLFEQEQKFVFERTWNFLALESQLPKPCDFVTAHIGRVPVLLTRDRLGKLGGFLNICRHKGALLCAVEQGNARYHTCPYHGWTYEASGKNADIKDRDAGAYRTGFDSQTHDLIPLARLGVYKGLIFGSLAPDVPELADYLGDIRFFLDLAMEQGPNGMEFVPGRMAYSYRGNWKLQLDNNLDPYHLTTTHLSFIGVQTRRRQGTGYVEARGYDWAKRAKTKAGTFTFRNGHAVYWADQPEPEKRPIFPSLAEVKKRVGEDRAQWMLKNRNLQVFPNMQIAETAALMLRTYRPLAVDLTEMKSYCLAPIGESEEKRAWRLRQYEDFFNPSGMATPDDTVTYEDCQAGFRAPGHAWLQGYQRGMGDEAEGANDIAKALGIHPTASAVGSFEGGLETGLHGPYREWGRLMQAGLAGQKAYP